MNQIVKKTKIELTIELLKVIIWPTIVIFVIILFWRPIYSTFNEIPNIIGKSESISIGNLSIKIQRGTTLLPSESVKAILKKISPHAVETLVSSNGTTEYFHTNQVLYGQQRFKELIQDGLYIEVEKIHLSYDDQNIQYAYGVQPTKSGIEVRNYLLEIMNGLIKEI